MGEDCAQFLQSRPVKKVCHKQHERNAEQRPCTEQTEFTTQYTCVQSARRLPQLCKQCGVSQQVHLILMFVLVCISTELKGPSSFPAEERMLQGLESYAPNTLGFGPSLATVTAKS